MVLLRLFRSRTPAPPVAVPAAVPQAPGSHGEHALQQQYGTAARANAFYANQVLDHLNDAMQEFVGRMEMVVVATADAHGECDASFRAGPPGFVHVLDDRTVAYPEYRGNGVMASLGNMAENPHVGLLFVDYFRDKVGLHINGKAHVVESEVLGQRELPAALRADMEVEGGRKPERWVVVDVEEAYIHCSKHIPLLRKANPGEELPWGTDDVRAKGGDHFGVAAARRGAAARVA